MSAAEWGAVALVDWNRGGHHATYLREYAKALRASGRRVAVLAPEADSVVRDEGVVARTVPPMEWIKKRRWLPRAWARRLYARLLARELARAERRLGQRCGQVFASCLYEGQAEVAEVILSVLKRPASGLYLHAGVFRAGDAALASRGGQKVLRLLRHPSLRSLFLLDGEMAAAVEAAAGKPVVLAPDFADATPPGDYAPATAARALAGARPVIGLLGHLRPSKGVADLARLAVEHAELDAVFLFAGELLHAAFSEEDLAWIRRARDLSGRVVFLEGRIPDEASYNALVAASDVLYAVYRDAPHSSNTLTKAALFGRPVLAGTGGVIEGQTRDFRLGEVVAPGDAAASVAALRRLAQAGWAAGAKPRWAEFRELQSPERLRALFENW